MLQEKLTSRFPLLISKTAILFRYDWQDKLWLLEVESQAGTRTFLACYGCQSIQIGCSLHLDEVVLVQEVDCLKLSTLSNNFLLKCNSIELWDGENFSDYDSRLYKSVGGENGYGKRKPITNINELR